MTSASHQADADTTWPHGPLTLVLFDLDGTLSDSARGITASMRHALGVHDVAVPEQHVLDSFVGPPFKVALEGIGIPAEQVPGIVGTYREDYNAGRLFDNDLYPGMADLLAELEKVSGRDLEAWTRVWLQEAGVTTLRMSIETDGDDAAPDVDARISPPYGRYSADALL